jgi:phage terminase large subunit-like protein
VDKKKARLLASSSDPVTAYALLVSCGDIVAGPHVRNACRRHLRDLKRPKKFGIYFDLDACYEALDFFPACLKLSEGQFDGRPFELAPAQQFIVGSIFGWKMLKTGKRRFTKAYIEMGKGNGKSPLAAGIGLYGLVADGESGAQVYAAAAKMDQARILFNDAVNMVSQSPELSAVVRVMGLNPPNTLNYHSPYTKTVSLFKPLGRDTGKTGSGLRPSFALVDELHEHPNDSTLTMLERGFKSREQPLLLMITNSGSDRGSTCFREHTAAVKAAADEGEWAAYVRRFSYVCAMDEDDDPLDDPSVRIKANPLLGYILSEEYLEGVASEARAMPGKANAILRLHFCVWTDAVSAWIARQTWEGCEDPEMQLDEFEGEECWLGLDLGATKDFTAKSYVFKDGLDVEGRQKFALFCHGYTPADTLAQRAKDDQADYEAFVRVGSVTALPGKVIRLDFVARDIWEDAQRFYVQSLAYDRWLFRDFETNLDEYNISMPLAEHPQGFNRRKDSDLWMPGSIDTFETLILEGRLRIQVNPFLRSCVMSATFLESPAGLKRFEKSRATARIDAAVSSAMAIGVASAIETEVPRSYMAEKGPIFV